MNKKMKECENIEFLPDEYRGCTDLDLSEKNVLATLCYCYLRYSDYAAEHNGWFFTAGKELGEETGIDERTVYRILVKLELKGLVKRKRGTNHKCTHYKLHPSITELLPKGEDFEGSEEANVTLEEKRLDESSLEETRRDESSTFENKKKFNYIMSDEITEYPDDDYDCSDVDEETLEEYERAMLETSIPWEIESQHPSEGAAPQQDVTSVLLKFKDDIDKAKTKQELKDLKDKLLKSGIKIPDSNWEFAVKVFNHYDWRCVTIRH